MKIFFRVGGSIKNIEQNTNFERISMFGTKCQKISTDLSKVHKLSGYSILEKTPKMSNFNRIFCFYVVPDCLLQLPCPYLFQDTPT